LSDREGPVDERSDQDLVDAMNGGDVAAFEALYRRHRDWVVRLATRFAGDRDEALDVLQETFRYFLGKFPGFELRARVTTFLYPVVRHIAIDLGAKRRPAVGLAAAALEGLVAAPWRSHDAEREELAEVLAALSPLHREVVLMRFVDGFALEEIGVALSIPTGTVKSRLHNALRTLREDPRTRRHFGVDADRDEPRPASGR